MPSEDSLALLATDTSDQITYEVPKEYDRSVGSTVLRTKQISVKFGRQAEYDGK